MGSLDFYNINGKGHFSLFRCSREVNTGQVRSAQVAFCALPLLRLYARQPPPAARRRAAPSRARRPASRRSASQLA